MIDYVGNELELFRHAHNWKTYYSNEISKYIKGDVLEVGAGFGANSKYLCNHNTKSWTFIEPDSNLSSKISDSTINFGVPKKIITGTIYNLSDETFDSIIYIDVLEHIEKSKDEIQRLKLHLRDTGHLIILVPAFQFMYSEFDLRLGHFRRYNKALLMDEVGTVFIKEKLFYLDSCGFIASLFNKIFLKQPEISLKQVLFWDKVLIQISKVIDIIFFRNFGKSLIGIFKNVSS